MDEHTRPHYERSALLTIDIQRDFLSNGQYAIAGTTEVLPAVRRLVKAYRAWDCPRGTLFGASERDYRAVLVNDAVSQWNEHAGAELGSLGVVTATTSEVLAQLGATD